MAGDNYSTKTRQAGCANEQSMNSLMSMHETGPDFLKLDLSDTAPSPKKTFKDYDQAQCYKYLLSIIYKFL